MPKIQKAQPILQSLQTETTQGSLLDLPRKLPDELLEPSDHTFEQKLIISVQQATSSNRLTILDRVFLKDFWNNIGFAPAIWDLIAAGGLPSLLLKAAATRDQNEALRFIAKVFIPQSIDCIASGILAQASQNPAIEKIFAEFL